MSMNLSLYSPKEYIFKILDSWVKNCLDIPENGPMKKGPKTVKNLNFEKQKKKNSWYSHKDNIKKNGLQVVFFSHHVFFFATVFLFAL